MPIFLTVQFTDFELDGLSFRNRCKRIMIKKKKLRRTDHIIILDVL